MSELTDKNQPRDPQGRFAETTRPDIPRTDDTATHADAIAAGESMLGGRDRIADHGLSCGDGRTWSFANVDGEPVSMRQASSGFYEITNHDREYEGSGVIELDGNGDHAAHGHYDVRGTDEALSKIDMMENTCARCSTTATKGEIIDKLPDADENRVMVTTDRNGTLTITPTTDSGGNVIPDTKLAKGVDPKDHSAPAWATAGDIRGALTVMDDENPIRVGTDHTNGIVLMQDRDLPNGDAATVGVTTGQHSSTRTVCAWPSRWTDEKSLPEAQRPVADYDTITASARRRHSSGAATVGDMTIGALAGKNPDLTSSRRWYSTGESAGVDGVFDVTVEHGGESASTVVTDERNGGRWEYDSFDEAISKAASLY